MRVIAWNVPGLTQAARRCRWQGEARETAMPYQLTADECDGPTPFTGRGLPPARLAFRRRDPGRDQPQPVQPAGRQAGRAVIPACLLPPLPVSDGTS
jgi:hypothetical protein